MTTTLSPKRYLILFVKVDFPDPEPPAIPIIILSLFIFSYLSSPNSSGINLGQIFSDVQMTVDASLVPIPQASRNVLP